MLSTYADSDGTRVYPGLARIAVDAELTYNTVKASMAALRAAGLIELVRQAGGRGDSDEYRLTLAEDLLERVEVLTPAQVVTSARRIRDGRRGQYRGSDVDDLRPTGRAAGGQDAAVPAAHGAGRRPVDNSDLRPTARAADGPSETLPAAHGAGPVADLRPTAHATCGPRRDPPPCTTTSQVLPTNSESDLRTAVTVGARGPADPKIHPSSVVNARRRPGPGPGPAPAPPPPGGWPIVHVRQPVGAPVAAELRTDDPARHVVRVVYRHSRTSAWIDRARIVTTEEP